MFLGGEHRLSTRFPPHLKPVHALSLYPEWADIFERLPLSPAVVMVMGAVDSGKTTLSSMLIRHWQQQKYTTGVMDLDLGQSEVGPPATLSHALVQPPFTTLGDLAPRGLAFIGDIAPVRYVPQILVGARRMLDDLLTLEPDVVVMDTCGYVQGMGARNFKLQLVEILRPSHLFVLQRGKEMEPIIGALQNRTDWDLTVVPVPALISRKSPTFRAENRRVLLARYFAEAKAHTLEMDQVSFIGRRLGAGIRLTAESLRLEDAIREKLLHVERQGSYLHVIARQMLTDAEIGTLQTVTGTDQLRVLPPKAYRHLLAGLTDHAGRTFGMAIIQSVDFKERLVHLLAPVHSVQPVKWVQLGYLRVLPDGTELTHRLQDG
jgi:polynucleotide 5'-hydroxyl-kinase GRC3/NOL9